ncbi:MAG: Fic family protein [Chitinophagaceae bacterium]
MQILSEQYFDNYLSQLDVDLSQTLQQLSRIDLTPKSFTFYTSIAVISSSRIEGEKMEVDSYVKHKMQDIEYLPELIEKPNDLFQAYQFARNNELTKDNFLQSHALLSKHLLPEKWRGAYRQNEMLVMEHNTGRIQYEAAPFSLIEAEIKKLWLDIEGLKKENLVAQKVFYYASLIHLVFVNIHPFNDGNGRAARLLEKWFLATMLGENAWFIQSEKYYYEHVKDYYQNLNRQGMFYESLDYSKADRFLQMLPKATANKS